jgi:antitoxin (DNA-binding transcriptional repressor) of toxin-antitoxin stability system
MIAVTATEGANSFHRLLELAERGETVRILKHGRVRAKIVQDTDFMDGKAVARIFAGYRATELDKAAADEIGKNLQAMKKRSREKILAH